MSLKIKLFKLLPHLPGTNELILSPVINTAFLFPPQVKKLVYVYLVRYAEEQQDLALLSISTFQRALKVRQWGVVVWME